MSPMLQGGYLSILAAKSRDEFRLELVRFAKQLGFDTVSATAVFDRSSGDSEFITIDNTPAEYEAHFGDHNKNKRDPVMQHCKTKGVPILWGQSTYIDAGEAEIWETQARYGYRVGIALAMHMPHGRHFFVGVDRDQALSESPAEVTRMAAALQLFAVHAQEAALRLLVPATGDSQLPSLTPRELETLRWTMEGKTAWEVGRILGIAEDTVIRHAHSASRKLGCSSKHHAVVKALRLGLIQ
jgi:DNA-binding CsgD family transcriptional regulator